MSLLWRQKKTQLCFYLSKNADTRHNWVRLLYDIYTVVEMQYLYGNVALQYILQSLQ